MIRKPVELSATLLTQLRAFEAVARTGSFTHAAEELYVTQSAVSHHVRHLEQLVGEPLLHRLHRRVDVTAVGRELALDCSRGFGTIRDAVHRLLEPRRADHTLTITVAPYFSARWLTPRLGSLWAAHPGLDVRLHHAYEPVDFTRDDVDGGIVWGSGRWLGSTSTRVLTGALIPVCSPAMRRQLPQRLRAQHLLGQTLLYEFDERHWRSWFTGAGVDIDETTPLDGRQIDDSHALRRAAIDGHGVALFFRGLIEEDLEQGLLVAPIDATVDPGSAYHFVRPSGVVPSTELRAFTRWLAHEVRARPWV